MAETLQNNNKRIAKNTLLLYFRMLFMMGIALYTNRVVLDKLGVEDFGIYNVVGGIVVMLGFLSGCMSNSVQRFLSYELGKNNKNRVNRVFNVSLTVHVCISIVILIAMETVGLWFLNNKMNIPVSRMNAANWVFQCSIITMMFTVVQVPYNAIIISKEKMGIYAYISILEVSLKLIVVYLLCISSIDKLKLYAILIMIVTIGILLVYRVYCVKRFEEARFCFIKDGKLFKEIISFSGWNMLSEIAWTFTGPGVNILLNIFYGPAINAARGLAEQVNGAVSRFVQNFQTAVNPQLIKMYAAEEYENMKILLFRSTRFSFYLLFALSLPLIIEMDFILHLWLKNVPMYTIEFCQLILVYSLVSVNSTLLPKIVWANGNIRRYQIVVSVILFLNFPLSYFLLVCGLSPLATTYLAIVIQLVIIRVRLHLVSKIVSLSKKQYLKEVIIKNFEVAVVSFIIPYCIKYILNESFISSIVIMIVSFLSVLISTYILGLQNQEKLFVKGILKKYLKIRDKK